MRNPTNSPARAARCAALATLLCASLVLPAAAQEAAAPDAGKNQVSRTELQRLLNEYTKTAESRGYSAAFRERARDEAALIRERLTDGDLQVGDRIQLQVENQKELTDTFVVATGRTLVLPNVGSIPLNGVLRSEIEPYLTQQMARYIRNPVVHARSLLRVLITGSVGKPGFYLLPSESLVTDALMAAGGPGANAQIEKVRIERDGRAIWEVAALQQAITEGRTLDQLSLRAGDRIVVPTKGGTGWEKVRDIVFFASSVGLLLNYFVLRH